MSAQKKTRAQVGSILCVLGCGDTVPVFLSAGDKPRKYIRCEKCAYSFNPQGVAAQNQLSNLIEPLAPPERKVEAVRVADEVVKEVVKEQRKVAKQKRGLIGGFLQDIGILEGDTDDSEE